MTVNLALTRTSGATLAPHTHSHRRILLALVSLSQRIQVASCAIRNTRTMCSSPAARPAGHATVRIPESTHARASQRQIHSQNHLLLSPKSLTYGVFDREFGFDSQEWGCSQNNSTQGWGVKGRYHSQIAVSGCPRPLHTANLIVNLTMTRASGAAL